MIVKKIHIIITMIAALVVAVLSLFTGGGAVPRSLWLIGTIAIFYLIGLMVRYYLTKHVFGKPKEAAADEQAADDE